MSALGQPNGANYFSTNPQFVPLPSSPLVTTAKKIFKLNVTMPTLIN